jgi:hypothetical protein
MLKLLLALAVPAVLAGAERLTPVPFTTVGEGQQSGIEERREVTVRTAAEWKTLWKQHAADQTMPAVDFSKSMVVGVFLGMRNTGGYRVTITAIDREGSDLVVTWREEAPARDAMVSQMLTFPFHLVRLEQTKGPVKFRRSTP